jgi:hypothetical protein
VCSGDGEGKPQVAQIIEREWCFQGAFQITIDNQGPQRVGMSNQEWLDVGKGARNVVIFESEAF